MDILKGVAAGHTLIDMVVADPKRRDFVERVAGHDLVAPLRAPLPGCCAHGSVTMYLLHCRIHAIHATYLCLEGSMALLPLPLLHAPLSSLDLRVVASFG